MKKEYKCKLCGSSFGDKYFCDICGTELIGIPIILSFGFGSPLDGEEYHFCDFKCAIKFLISESTKQNPRTDIEFGNKTLTKKKFKELAKRIAKEM